MYFFEPKHIYYKNFIDDYDYISASGVLKLLKEKYDSAYWSMYKAYEFYLYKTNIDPTLHIDDYLNNKPAEPKKYFKNYKRGYDKGDYKLFSHLKMYADESKVIKIQQYILATWEKVNINSINKGHNYHADREEKALASEFCKNPFTGKILPIITNNEWISLDVKKRIVDLSNLQPGFYPEIILDYDCFCGQADKVWFEPLSNGKLGFWIDDYKTNIKLDFVNPYQSMLYPLNHLDDCNWNHYQVQLSFYSWILIQYGYVYMGSRLTHCIQNETDNTKWKRIPYEFEYMKDEIEAVTSYVKNNNLHKSLI